MNNIFTTDFINQRDPEVNTVRMNTLVTELITNAAFCDCQSFPLKQYFGDLYVGVRHSVEHTFDKFLKDAPVALRPSNIFERFVDTTPYADTIQYRAEVPEGLKVTFLEYLAVLIPSQQYANDVLKNIIDPFSKFVGKLISDPMARNQALPQIKEFTTLEVEYDTRIAAFTKCFGKNDYHSSSAFGEVVKRNSDWKKVFQETKELKKLYEDFPLKDISKKLNLLYEMLDKLVDQIKLDAYDGAGKELTQQLGIGMYEVAKQIEMAAAFTFRSKVFITTMDKTIESIDGLVKRGAINRGLNSPVGDHEYR